MLATTGSWSLRGYPLPKLVAISLGGVVQAKAGVFRATRGRCVENRGEKRKSQESQEEE